MIHGFPVPYRDEMFYSLLARRERQMDYPSYKSVLREVFGRTLAVVAFEFPSHLLCLMKSLPHQHPCSGLSQLEKTSSLCWYVPFLPAIRTNLIRQAMLGRGGSDCWNRAGITSSRVKSLRFLRYCADCLREDRAAEKTPYWRRLHQMAGIEVCPKHSVFLEDSDIERLKRRYRYFLPSESLLEKPSRRIKTGDGGILGLARLGEQLLGRDWPILGLVTMRQNYLLKLGHLGYCNARGQVKMGALLHDLESFYTRGFLERLGCRGEHWVARMLRTSASIQQPIRHLLLLNCVGMSLEELFSLKPMTQQVGGVPVIHDNLVCSNHLCPEHRAPVCEFVAEERSSMLGGAIESYRCHRCGQVQARCGVTRVRTWVRDYGHLWRTKLKQLWADPHLSLRRIARELQVSCDTARKHALKLGLPLTRPGHRPLSVRGYPHLLAPRADRRLEKIKKLRNRWMRSMEKYRKLNTRGLRKKLPAVYATLFRYDRTWLKSHQPARRARALVVNWAERDAELCLKLEIAAKQLPDAPPGHVARAVGLRGWISHRLAKLPRAQIIWSRLIRSNLRGDSRRSLPPKVFRR